jgi:hypothetical protein
VIPEPAVSGHHRQRDGARLPATATDRDARAKKARASGPPNKRLDQGCSDRSIAHIVIPFRQFVSAHSIDSLNVH